MNDITYSPLEAAVILMILAYQEAVGDTMMATVIIVIGRSEEGGKRRKCCSSQKAPGIHAVMPEIYWSSQGVRCITKYCTSCGVCVTARNGVIRDVRRHFRLPRA